MFERYVKRTIYVSECGVCGDRTERPDNPPKERQCRCGQWVPFVEQSYVGPELGRAAKGET